MKNDVSGRSMIEMLGVLTIIGALSIGGMAGYTSAMHQNRVKQSVEQISVVSGHLSTLGAGSSGEGTGPYNGLNNKVAVKFKAILSEMKASDDTSNFDLKNPFGGSVTISSSNLLSSGGGSGQAYTIEYAGLDKKACAALATHDWGNSKNSSFIGVSAGGNPSADNIYLNCTGSSATTNNVTGCVKGSRVGIPVPMSEAATACGSCSNCIVVLKYY